MRQLTFALITLFSLLQIVLGEVDNEIQTSINGCSLDNLKYTKGLKGTIYQLDKKQSTLSSNSAFYQGSFSTESVLGTFLNTKSAEFSFPGGFTTFSGIEVDTSHIVMEEAGYFKADTTGIYRFDLTNIDDGAMVFIGGAAYDCCSGSFSGGNEEPFLFGFKKPNDDSNPILKSWVYLEAGLVYPFKAVYFNGISAGSMLLKVTPPDGSPVDIAHYIYQVDNVGQKNCVPEVIQTSFTTSTKWVFSEGAQQITKKSSLVTSNGSTYIETEIVYGIVRKSTVKTNWTGSTTSYTTRTIYVTDGYEYVKEEIDVYRPPASTVTRYNRVQGTATVTNYNNNIIYVNLPIPSTTVVLGKEPFTTTVEVVIDNKTTRVVSVGVTDLPVTTVYPKTFVTTKATTRIGGTWYEVIYENLSTSYITVGLSVGTTYPVTTTISNAQTTFTSTYLVIETIAPISESTSYYTGVRRSTDKTFVATLTSSGQTYGYYSYIYYIPFLKTSIKTGTIGTTTTVTGAYTTYVQVITNAPTIITYDPTVVQKTNRIATTVVGTSTGYIVEEIYPPPVVIPVEYTGSTTSTSTRWITNGVGSTVAWDEIRYVPALSTSYSFWTNTYATTKYITSIFSYGPDLYSTTTIRFVQRPPPGKTTNFWTGTKTTTTYSTTTFPGNNNIPVTDIIQIVLVPSPIIVLDGCSKQVHTITCTGNTSIFPIGDKFATVTGTTCEMPDYISGSFLATTSTSTVTVEEITTEIAYVNVVDPTITCFTTTPVLDCNSNTVVATCEYGTTSVSKEDNELTVLTTSCTVPSGISGSFIETVTTLTRSGKTITVTNGIVPSFICEPSITTTIFTTCESLTVHAPCTISKTLVDAGTATVILSQTSCEMPDDFTGSFDMSTSVTQYFDDATTTAFTITNINDPVVECKVSSKFESSILSSFSLPSKPTWWSSSKESLTSSASSSLLQSSSISSLSQLSSTSASLSQSSSSSSSLLNSSISSFASSSTVTQSSQHSPVPSLPPVITKTTVNTVCEFSTTTLTNDVTILTEVVLTPANSCMTKFTTTTLTETNHEDCNLKTTTSSNTVVGNDEITTVEVGIVILTPKPECFESSTITTVVNSVCSLETNVWTSTVQEENITVTIVDTTIKTPPASCEIFYTEYPATDCGTKTETSFIATTNWEGKYINGTLIIVETPNISLCPLTSGSEILSSKETQTNASTIYTTSYTIVTITSCSDNHCHISELPTSTETTTTTESITNVEPTESTIVPSSHSGGKPEPESSTIETISDTERKPSTTATTFPVQPTTDYPSNETNKSTTSITTSSLPIEPTVTTSTANPDVPIFETNFEGVAPADKVSFMRSIFAILLSALIF